MKPGGRLAHYTIFIPPDLEEGDYRRAAEFWSAATTRGRSQRELLEAAGFVEVDEVDVTEEYRATVRSWLEGRKLHYDGLVEAIGKDALDEKIAEGEETLQKLGEGLLRRSFLMARRAAHP